MKKHSGPFLVPERGDEMYVFTREDCDCKYCKYKKGNRCTLKSCCCLEDKIRTGSPLLNKEDDKRLKELKQKYRKEGY